MSKESIFNISPDQIIKISLELQEENSQVVMGRGELRNAIFETIAIQHNLPWDKRIGAPDWNNPLVKRLYAEFRECYEAASEIEVVDDVEARCNLKDCDWNVTEYAYIEMADRVLQECPLTDECRNHHVETGLAAGHNHFSLFKDGESIGSASVSRQVATGYIKPLE